MAEFDVSVDRGDVDYFRLLVTGATIDLAIASYGEADTYGQLLNSSGQVLSENDDGLYNAPGFFVEARVEAGTYYVKVRGLSSSTTGSYSLAVGAWLPSAGKVAVSHQQQLRP